MPAGIDRATLATVAHVKPTAMPTMAMLSTASDRKPGQISCASADSPTTSGMPGSTKSRPGHSPNSSCWLHARCMKWSFSNPLNAASRKATVASPTATEATAHAVRKSRSTG